MVTKNEKSNPQEDLATKEVPLEAIQVQLAKMLSDMEWVLLEILTKTQGEGLGGLERVAHESKEILARQALGQLWLARAARRVSGLGHQAHGGTAQEQEAAWDLVDSVADLTTELLTYLDEIPEDNQARDAFLKGNLEKNLKLFTHARETGLEALRALGMIHP